MALSIPERIAQVAEHFAAHSAHGYSQPNRGTGGVETVKLSDGSKVAVTNSDVDCSEMVRQCVNAALSDNYRAPIEYMWTGNEDEELRVQGFERSAFAKGSVRRGDILLRSGHTGVALGGGRQAEAAHDENGGITGPKRGDQTGREDHDIDGYQGDQTGDEVRATTLSSNWTYIYRHTDGNVARPIAATFRVTVTAETNVRSAPSMDASVTGTLPPGYKVTCDGWLQADGRIWATYLAASGKRRYISLGTSHSWVVVS